MDIIPGTHCAELLFAVHLPFEEVVRALMEVLDFTLVEATDAALAVQQRSPQLAAALRRG